MLQGGHNSDRLCEASTLYDCRNYDLLVILSALVNDVFTEGTVACSNLLIFLLWYAVTAVMWMRYIYIFVS